MRKTRLKPNDPYTNVSFGEKYIKTKTLNMISESAFFPQIKMFISIKFYLLIIKNIRNRTQK